MGSRTHKTCQLSPLDKCQIHEKHCAWFSYKCNRIQPDKNLWENTTFNQLYLSDIPVTLTFIIKVTKTGMQVSEQFNESYHLRPSKVWQILLTWSLRNKLNLKFLHGWMDKCSSSHRLTSFMRVKLCKATGTTLMAHPRTQSLIANGSAVYKDAGPTNYL